MPHVDERIRHMMAREIMERVTAEVLAKMQADGWYHGGRVVREVPMLWDINNGWCETWGEMVVALLPDAEGIWLDELPEACDEGGIVPDHYVVIWDGRYYDAEALDGVDRVQDLPIYLNLPRPAEKTKG